MIRSIKPKSYPDQNLMQLKKQLILILFTLNCPGLKTAIGAIAIDQIRFRETGNVKSETFFLSIFRIS